MRSKLSVFAVAALVATGMAQAGTVHFEVMSDEGLTSPGVPAAPATSNAASARKDFRDLLVGKVDENLQSYGVGVPNTPATLFSGSATLSQPAPPYGGQGTGYIDNTPYGALSATFEGRFDTTLTFDAANPGLGKWWETERSFQLDFLQGFSAFGFYGTDFGDFDGSFELEMLKAGGGSEKSGKISVTGGNGTLTFIGFYDSDPNVSYIGARFIINQTNPGSDDFNGFDTLGFDDLFTGQFSRSDVPEPGSIALVGASLLALGLTRRRRKA